MVKSSPKKGGAGKKPLSRSLRMYQRIAVAFVVGTLGLLLVVLYLSISRAVIHVVPKAKIVDVTVPLHVVPNPTQEGDMTGVVVEKTLTKAKTFSLPSDGGTPVEQKAGGMVTLINKTSAPQTLVGTTRLLSEEGVLFRIDDYVTVPAQGQLETMAHADVAGLSGEIPPTQFTIPGLPLSQQKNMYAVSVDTMTGGVSYVRTLSEQDLNDAVTSLTDSMILESKTTLAEGVDRTIFPGEAYRSEVLERKSDTQPGSTAGSFTVSLTVHVTAVYYDPALVTTYVQNRLVAQLPSEYVMKTANTDSMQISIDDAVAAKGTATLNAYLDGVGVISSAADAFRKDRFVGRSAQEVMTLLSVSDAIASSSVSFTPFWLKRVPTLRDHIVIDIEEPAP